MPALFRVIVISLLVATVGCEDSSRKARAARKDPSDPLARVSSALVLMEATIEIGQMTSCMMRDSFAKESGAGAGNSDLLDKYFARMMAEIEAKCALFEEATKKTAPVFQAIRIRGTLPADAYAFSLMDESENGFEEVEIGLFETAAACSELEGFAHDRDLATRRCRRWSDRF